MSNLPTFKSLAAMAGDPNKELAQAGQEMKTALDEVAKELGTKLTVTHRESLEGLLCSGARLGVMKAAGQNVDREEAVLKSALLDYAAVAAKVLHRAAMSLLDKGLTHLSNFLFRLLGALIAGLASGRVA